MAVSVHHWPYLSEVILLERNRFWSGRGKAMTTSRRTLVLHKGAGNDLFARWITTVAVGVMLLLSLWYSMLVLRGALVADLSLDWWEASIYTFYYPLALWLVVGYFTVVRFLAYLDLRIRREGWEVELMMRTEGAAPDEAVDMNVAAILLLCAMGAAERSRRSRPGRRIGRKALGVGPTILGTTPRPTACAASTSRRRRNRRSASPSARHASLGLEAAFQVMAWTVVGLILAIIVFLLVRAYMDRQTAPRDDAAAAEVGAADRVEALPFPVRAGAATCWTRPAATGRKATSPRRSSTCSATNSCSSTSSRSSA